MIDLMMFFYSLAGFLIMLCALVLLILDIKDYFRWFKGEDIFADYDSENFDGCLYPVSHSKDNIPLP